MSTTTSARDSMSQPRRRYASVLRSQESNSRVTFARTTRASTTSGSGSSATGARAGVQVQRHAVGQSDVADALAWVEEVPALEAEVPLARILTAIPAVLKS